MSNDNCSWQFNCPIGVLYVCVHMCVIHMQCISLYVNTNSPIIWYAQTVKLPRTKHRVQKQYIILPIFAIGRTPIICTLQLNLQGPCLEARTQPPAQEKKLALVKVQAKSARCEEASAMTPQRQLLWGTGSLRGSGRYFFSLASSYVRQKILEPTNRRMNRLLFMCCVIFFY